jgi:hypothetical protein
MITKYYYVKRLIKRSILFRKLKMLENIKGNYIFVVIEIVFIFVFKL